MTTRVTVPARRLLVVALVLTVAITACSSDDDDATGGPGTVKTTTTKAGSSSSTSSSSSPPTTSVTTTSTAPATTTTLACPPPPATTTPVTSAPAAAAVVLRAVSVTTDPCIDTVTLGFSAKTATMPGYTVSYQPGPITADASGEPVAVAGTAYLFVRLEPAYGYDFDANQPSYAGPDRLPAPGAHHVQEVVKTGDFEAVITWVIGVDAQRPFAVSATGGTNPQLVITVA